MEKCYNVMVTGKVQDISFRSLIEEIARLLEVKGFVFNDIDGSVKMVCCGENSVISKFFNEIKIRGKQKGALIEDITKEEIPFHIYLPDKFLRLYTDELADIGRKLDIGNDELKGVNTKLSNVDGKLSSVDNRLFDIGEDTHNLNTVMSSFVIEQKKHNQNLGKILEKLAER
ncbi:MAG: acylphosphatase [Candidatus Methanoperedens sp.]